VDEFRPDSPLHRIDPAIRPAGLVSRDRPESPHYGKPAFNNETGREVRHRNDDPIHRRKQMWIAAAAGG
jgi:hypothetical protein